MTNQKPLNVNTLDPRLLDNINRMVAITKSLYFLKYIEYMWLLEYDHYKCKTKTNHDYI